MSATGDARPPTALSHRQPLPPLVAWTIRPNGAASRPQPGRGAQLNIPVLGYSISSLSVRGSVVVPHAAGASFIVPANMVDVLVVVAGGGSTASALGFDR
jgi:hypothetical protein